MGTFLMSLENVVKFLTLLLFQDFLYVVIRCYCSYTLLLFQDFLYKPGVPIRLIVSYSGSPLYNINKYIANILKAYVKDENKNIKNSTTFSNYISNVPIEDDEIMVSFYVTSFYTNIPIIDTLKLIKDYVNNDDQFTRKWLYLKTSFFI